MSSKTKKTGSQDISDAVSDNSAESMRILELARKQRHAYLLEKIQANKGLTPGEQKEYQAYETMEADSTKVRRNGRIADEQLLKTQREAAKYADVNERTIRRWVLAGMPQTKEGFYIKSFLDFFKHNQGHEPSGDRARDLKAQADLRETKAQLAKLELAIKEGELIGRDAVEQAWVQRVVTVKRAFLGLGRSVASRYPPNMRRKLQADIDASARNIINIFATSQ